MNHYFVLGHVVHSRFQSGYLLDSKIPGLSPAPIGFELPEILGAGRGWVCGAHEPTNRLSGPN